MLGALVELSSQHRGWLTTPAKGVLHPFLTSVGTHTHVHTYDKNIHAHVCTHKSSVWIPVFVESQQVQLPTNRLTMRRTVFGLTKKISIIG